jgi:magnesium transporter
LRSRILVDGETRQTNVPQGITTETLVILAGMGREKEVREGLVALHPADIAELINAIEKPEVKNRVFGFLDRSVAPQVLSLVSPPTRQEIVPNLSEDSLQEILERLDSDDAADLLSSLSSERAQVLLDRLSRPLSAEMRELLRYPADTAGGIMQTEVVAVPEDATVEKVIEIVRSRAEEVPDIHNVFVVDHHSHLLGVLPLRKLILARPGERVDAVMDKQVISAQVDTGQVEVAQIFKKYDLVSLPVIDSRGALLGHITIDDVVDVLEEEATEDFYKLAGLGQEEHALEPPLHAIRQRLPWLVLNLLTTAISAAVIAFFEGTIEKVAIAAAFMTIVAAQGGNAAVQSLAVIVRGLALGEVTFAHFRRVMVKELAVGFGNGIVLGGAAGMVAYLWKGQPLLGLVLGLALVVNHLVAVLVGSMIPLILRRLNIDPAVASNVFVTACTDIAGFFTFLGFLTLALPYV